MNNIFKTKKTILISYLNLQKKDWKRIVYSNGVFIVNCSAYVVLEAKNQYVVCEVK